MQQSELRDSTSDSDSPVLNREQNNNKKNEDDEESAASLDKTADNSSEHTAVTQFSRKRAPGGLDIQYNPMPGVNGTPGYSPSTSVNNFLTCNRPPLKRYRSLLMKYSRGKKNYL